MHVNKWGPGLFFNSKEQIIMPLFRGYLAKSRRKRLYETIDNMCSSCHHHTLPGAGVSASILMAK